MKRSLAILIALSLTAALVSGCAGSGSSSDTSGPGTVQTEADAGNGSGGTADTETAANDAGQADDGARDNGSGLEDGVYIVDFHTDSTMFHLNEMSEGQGVLTVEDGAMTVHVTLVSHSIVHAYYGTAEEAAAAEEAGEALIDPTFDIVDYNDGTEPEEVHGYDLPVPAVDTDYTVAIIGTHGNWYSHTVSVTDPVPIEEAGANEFITIGS